MLFGYLLWCIIHAKTITNPMKTQAPAPSKLQLVRFTVARLNSLPNAGGNKGFTDSDTTNSSVLCRTIMI